MRYHRLAIALGLWSVLLSGGCTSLDYYRQAMQGHLDIMSRREPVAEILADPGRDAALRARLRVAQGIRAFASKELALPDNGSYRSYVDVGRDAVTWNVFATAEFSLEPRLWCFPLVGCVVYRGYFSEDQAQRFAQALREQGLDVYVGRATAYSTLGWFDDPLLSTMLQRGETALAGIVFHELAHQVLYVDDDTAFNEAFAMTVQEEGVRRWLRRRGGATELAAYEQALRRSQGFLDLVDSVRRHLAALYASGVREAAMREAKQGLIQAMRRRYVRLKADWDGHGGFDAWFDAPINNAKLVSVAVYRELVPDFNRLLQCCGGDLARFYRRVAEIGALDPDVRHPALHDARDCGPAAAARGKSQPSPLADSLLVALAQSLQSAPAIPVPQIPRCNGFQRGGAALLAVADAVLGQRAVVVQ
jgi:predicted aminopeptidase